MPKLKIFLMTRNEPELIEDWIRYHAHFFGMDNIHILDGSDNDFVLSVYEKFRPKGLNVHYSRSGLDDLANELTALMHQHKGHGNFLIKLDTDEFLAHALPTNFRPRTARTRGLIRRLVKQSDEKGSSRTVGLIVSFIDYYFSRQAISTDHFDDFFADLPVTGQRYKASFTVWSHPKEKYCAQPCRALEDFTTPQFTHMKSFFHSDSFVSVDLGCHVGESKLNTGFIDTGLTIIHYHSVSIADSMRRARQVLVSHGYIKQGDSVEQELEKLLSLKGQNIASFHKIDLYLSYLMAQQAGESLSLDRLNRQHPYFRPGRNKKMTAVKDALESVGR